jgi:hypothetical protein
MPPHYPPRKSFSGPRPLADYLEPCLGKAMMVQGFASSDLFQAWPDIIGSDLVPFCEPVRLTWRSRTPHRQQEEAATLVVRAPGAFALELSQQSATLIERINARYGWRCVGRITIQQGDISPRSALKKPRPSIPSASLPLQNALVTITDDALKAALLRLGAGMENRYRKE